MKTGLVAVDGSAVSDKALDFAVGLVRSSAGALDLLIVNVAEDLCPLALSELDVDTIRDLSRKEADATLAAALDRARLAGVAARGLTETGSPADVIDAIAQREGVGQVVIGSHGRHGARKLALGSVSGRVAEWAPCTVTIVK
jgi:nucleotide-binding universal stress UspA family protein